MPCNSNDAIVLIFIKKYLIKHFLNKIKDFLNTQISIYIYGACFIYIYIYIYIPKKKKLEGYIYSYSIFSMVHAGLEIGLDKYSSKDSTGLM
jgi:hypothetical protein